MQITSPPGAPLLPPSAAGYDVAFDDVHFSYRRQAPILNGVTFTVPAGTTCALVGTSGSGKSTLLRLLFRFYDPTAGTVRLHGRDVREWDLPSLRQPMGSVPQDVTLFNDTILYNISYGRPEADRGEMEAAARSAALHDAIVAMPDGYDTMVGERGLKLSGGEKQRLALARAFLKVRVMFQTDCTIHVAVRRGHKRDTHDSCAVQRPSILLFDEATSALDSTTEREILSSVASLAEGRTAIFVAHRLSTAAQCDNVVVLEAGRVLETGSHTELLERGGKYAQLWAQQATVDDIDAIGAPS